MRSKRLWLAIGGTALLVVVVAAAWAVRSRPPDGTINPIGDDTRDRLTAHLALASEHRAAITDASEEGSQLVVFGRLVQRNDRTPIAGREIRFYQTDHTGSYQERVPGDESTARLSATLRTDGQGRFIVSTVLPGDYGTTPNTRHIHTTVKGAMPEAYDFYFVQYTNAGLASWARRSSQAFLLELQSGPDGLLVAEAELAVGVGDD